MKIFDTANLDERLMRTLSADEAAHIYNGLDCCVTAEIYNELSEQIKTEPENVQETYKVAMAKLAPILEMSMRGTLIDEFARQESIRSLEKDLAGLDSKFQRIMTEVFGSRLNWNSPKQLQTLFYNLLGLKPVKKRNQNGVFAPTTNREALEFMAGRYLYAKPLANMILALRDISKQLSFLKTEIDPDQRIRTSYNTTGTNTGRLSSRMSDFGTGTNLQNVNRKLRYPFVADPGMYLVNVDLEQADGRNVGAICHDLFYDRGPEFASSYLDACESGDLHTTVCKMTWPELYWPEDEDEWKSFCDSIIAHGQDSYRQLAKKLGHGTNYYGTPRTMAKHAHVPTKIIEEFQQRYFKQFSCIPEWHKSVISDIKNTGTITTLFGRRRMFFGRGNDASTHRKAIAYAPQSMTGEQIDRGLLQVWRKYPQVQLLNQVHDSILFQIPYSEAKELIPAVLETMKVTLTLKGGRKFTVPLEAQTGWNWSKATKQNPYGLQEWTGKEERPRPTPKNRLKDFFKAPARTS